MKGMEEKLEERTEEKMKETGYSAMLIANYMVKQSIKKGFSLSDIKLQQLLYLTQLLYLNFHDRRLFGDKIEKFCTGPVVLEVFHTFDNSRTIQLKCTREEVVVTDAGDSFQTSIIPYDKHRIQKKDRQFIKSVLAGFSYWTTTQLVDLTTSLPSWKREVGLILSGNNPPIYTDEDMKMDLGKLTMAAFLNYN